MIIDNLDNLTFAVTDNEETGTISIVFTDPAGPTEVGTFQIAKVRADSFLRSLIEVCREVHGVFEPHNEVDMNLTNRTSGTVVFRDE